MSYDISIVVKGDEAKRLHDVELKDWNYTYNIRPMTKKAGLSSLRELDGLELPEALEKLEGVIKEMESDPVGYRALNPLNGWGDYDSFLKLLNDIAWWVGLYARLASPLLQVRVT